MNDIKTKSVQITGLSDLDKQMTQFVDKLQKKILVGGVRAGANVFRTEARSKAAVAERAIIKIFKGQEITVQPGFMQKAVRSWQRRKTKYAVSFSIGVAGWKNRFSKLFPFWWRFLEFGTAKMAAKPFLRPSYEAKKMEAIDQMKKYLSERMAKEVLKR